MQWCGSDKTKKKRSFSFFLPGKIESKNIIILNQEKNTLYERICSLCENTNSKIQDKV